VLDVHFIGTSDAFGAGGRRQSAFLARDAHGTLLVDCGATTNTGLAAEGIERDEIDAILVSHFHADHFGGIPLILIAALYQDHRTRPLEIAGPPGIETRVINLAAAMGHPLNDRDWTFPVVYTELIAGISQEVGPASVTSFETYHNKDVCPHGLKIAFDKRKLVYSGDTGWFEDLPRQVGESDLFVTECTYHTNTFDLHLNHELLMEHRDDFECGRLILTHLGSEMTSRRGAAGFDTADDGMIVQL